MKLTLDAKAIEKLIELSAPEFILELRNGVIQEICRRHIKNVHNELLAVIKLQLKNVEDALHNYVYEEVCSMIGTYERNAWSGFVFKNINQEALNQINNIVKQVYSDSIKELGNTYRPSESTIKIWVEDIYKSAIRKEVENEIKQEMLRKLES